jgi:hypothetical protein
MIGTPTIDGKLDVFYTQALLETLKLCAVNEIELFPIFIAYDSLVQRARNDLITMAYAAQVDDLIFIDADVEWNPQDFLKLLNYNVDMVGGTYRKKNLKEETYPIKIKKEGVKQNENGLIEIAGIGTGFLRLSKRCYIKLCEMAPEYATDGIKKARMVFDLSIVDGELHSEDITMCDKWINSGEQLWFDPSITCTHIGTARFEGNFIEYFNKNFAVPAPVNNPMEEGAKIL